jgi:hypothetical protein
MKKMELCRGRHEIPDAVDGAIFQQQVNPLDVDGMEQAAVEAVTGLDALTLYVTGLSVALVAVINACRAQGVELTLMHYDRESGSYYPQHVL